MSQISVAASARSAPLYLISRLKKDDYCQRSMEKQKCT